MLKQNYYYLVAGLPDLAFDETGRLQDSLEFRNEISDQVTPAYFELVELLYLDRNNKILLNQYFEKENRSQPVKTSPPAKNSYLTDFMEWARDRNPQDMRLEFENKLYGLYYDYVLDRAHNDFLKQWFFFELNVKNILTALTCKHFHYSFSKNLVKTKHANPVYTQLRHKQLKPELFEDHVPMAKEIFEIAGRQQEAEAREMEMDRIYWKYLDEQTNYDYFTIERILVHIIKLHILERWAVLDKSDGQAFLNQLIKEIKPATIL